MKRNQAARKSRKKPAKKPKANVPPILRGRGKKAPKEPPSDAPDLAAALKEAPKPALLRRRRLSVANLPEPETVRMIVNFARCGAHPEVAAGAMGIIPAIYRRWELQGCIDYRNGNDTQCARLVMGIVAAASQAELHELLSLRRGSDSARFILERRFGARWALKAPQVNIDLTGVQTEVGGEKPDKVVHQLSAEESAALTLLYGEYVGSQLEPKEEPGLTKGLKEAPELTDSLQ